MKKLSVAAAMIALLSTSAFAADQSAPFPAREAVSIKVSADGLDLSKPQDLNRLRGRMTKAIARACNPADVYSASISPDRQCYREMAVSADSVVQRIAQSQMGQRTAQN
ncbi:MAG TPA: UrcA family protein [Sphingobium sp.]